jgi:cytochrome c oxidase assembly protein subunit 15
MTNPSGTQHSALSTQHFSHWVAVAAAVFTWPLLFVGGLVTTYRVGMAVPDWPTTFGINMFLYNSWNAAWGVFIEHGHRLYGAAVGMATIVLAVWFALAERRRGMKVLGGVALLAVIGQGVLGGLRVRLNSTHLAAVHGCTAQAFFTLMVALCVLTGRDWVAAGTPRPDPDHLRRRSLVTLALVYAQVVAGALLRHFGAGLAVHSILAVAVWGHAAMLVWRVERQKAVVPELVRSARAMALTVSLQVALGVVAWWMLQPFDGIPREVTGPQALVRTGHLANGALLLASAVILTLRTFRHLVPAARAASSDLPARAPWDLETVA